MPITVSAISSPIQASLSFRTKSRISCVRHTRVQAVHYGNSGVRTLVQGSSTGFVRIPSRNLRFSFRRSLGICSKAEKENGASEDGVDETRGESTMPERFRYLTKEVSEPPIRWPWLIPLPFFIYAWRTVWWELRNWKRSLIAIIHFMGYLTKIILALIFHFIGNPVTSFIRSIETTLYSIRAFYSSIVASAPVPELLTIILLASAVLAIAETAVPESFNSQPYLLTISGFIAFAAVKGLVSEPLLWLLLLGLFCFARFFKKRDYVSSAMPAAAVLAAIGEPWIRVSVIGLYTALAVVHHSKMNNEELLDGLPSVRRVPLPLLGAALAIGIHGAAKWAGYRHLTWMIV